MRVFVGLNNQWFVVPCGEGDNTVQWLIEETLRRFNESSLRDQLLGVTAEKIEAVLVRSRSKITHRDSVKDALHDSDFVSLTVGFPGDVLSLKSTSCPEGALAEVNEFHNHQFIELDGCSLSVEALVALGKGELKIKLTDASEKKVNQSRKVLEDVIRENKVVYGVTTGFGKFARVVVPPEKLLGFIQSAYTNCTHLQFFKTNVLQRYRELQENLIRSHAAGVGKPLSVEHARMLLALRINVLAKGYSGISLKILKQLIAAFNVPICGYKRRLDDEHWIIRMNPSPNAPSASCIPWVPEQGTVGASGDLAPLAHLALGLLGEGQLWSPESGWADAGIVLETHGLEPLKLGPKEGLALINGTQLITSLGAEAVHRSRLIAKQADIIAAMSLEVLRGTTRAFSAAIHHVRPHKGQRQVAERLRAVLHSTVHPSEISESHKSCGRVQDAYTLRCCPQVHGVSNDTIDFVEGIIETEMNSATDNPIVFAETGDIISCGNFHGEYPAKALDYLAIGVHELASISERRIERLVNPAYSELPAFLAKEGGLNSGFMMAHCTAASLVSENKVLCHPSSVDSLPTSAGQEDHVSMGGFAARKSLKVVENVEKVLAIEVLVACQGIDFLRPLKTTEPLEAVYALVRQVVKSWDKDRFMAADIEAALKLVTEGKIWHVASPFMANYQSAT